MISTVTFETAALADAIKRLAKVAPSKGMAFDKASGIVIEFDPSSSVPLATLRATNLDIFIREWVNVAEWGGEPALWRLPSALLAQIITSLPIGTGHTVTLTSETNNQNYVVMLTTKPGRTKVKYYPIDPEYYPNWDAFDPEDMFPAKDLGGRIAQVEWAASTSQPELASVYLDGTNAIATDTYKIACVPLDIPKLDHPIVIPAGLLGQVLPATGNIQVGVVGSSFHVMPDDYTQVETVVFDTKYPNVNRIMERELDSEIKLSRDTLSEIMTRINSFAQGDRESFFDFYLGREEIGISLANEQVGLIGDVIDVPSYAEHPRFKIRFSPRNIMEAVAKSPNNDIVLRYNVGNSKTLFNIDGGSGYGAWVMPRVITE